MRKLKRFLRMPLRDQALMLQAAAVVLSVRLVLSLVPFRVWRPLIQQRLAPAPGGQHDKATVARVVAAVLWVSRYVPRASCLTQGLATQQLLSWRGYPTQLRIGVARGAGGQFQAHAWVEWQGTVIIGGADELVRFAVLPVEKKQAS